MRKKHRLDQGRTEEAIPAFALKPNPERFLKSRANGHERRRVPHRLDAGQAITGVGGQQPRQVLRLGQCSAVRERPGQILAETRANLAGEGTGRLYLAPEVVGILGQSEGFELDGASPTIPAHQDEVPQIRDQHQTVAVPIAAYLIGSRCQPRIVTNTLDLDDATLGNLPWLWMAFLNLPRRVQGKVGMTGPLIRQFLNAKHLGLERGSDRTHQALQRRIVRALRRRAARSAHTPKIGDVRLHGGNQFLFRFGHRVFPAIRPRLRLQAVI